MVARLPKPLRKIWKMLKCVREKIKSADEKIRSISKQPGSKPASPSAPEPLQREGDNMAERRIQQRQGRRDRFRGNEGGRGDQPSKAEIKRRSRSEGPTNRVTRERQLTEEGRQDDNFASYGKKNEKIVGPIWAVTHSSTATRMSRYSPPLSDDGNQIHVQAQRPAGSDSDSNESDTKVWTKNPLVMRKTKRTGKIEKRQSNSENGFSTGIPTPIKTNRESFVYCGSQDKGDSGGGGGSLKGNKYQKLEELRRKRIDIQMTSDEENTPESRISRLRQRAIQSGLGKQPRPDSFRQSAVIPGSPTQHYSPKSQGAFFQNGSSDPRSGGTSQQTGNLRSSITQSSYQGVNGAPSSSAYGSPYGAKQTSQSGGQNRQPLIRPFDPKGFSDSGIPTRIDAPANANRFSQHNEVRSPVTKTAVYNSSPEVVKRPFDRPRVPSVDSIYEGSSNQQPELHSPGVDYSRKFGAGTTYQNVGHGFVFMRPASSGTMEVPKGELVHAPVRQGLGQKSPSNFNEVVELRLKTSRLIDRPPSQSVLDQQRKLRANIAANSDDSLDELIESNIQYLESEIESGRAKKGSASVSRSASLPDPRRSSGHYTSVRSGPLHSGVLPTSYASAQQQGTTHTIPSQPHIKAGSELKYHIPIPGNQPQPPDIRIASENRFDSGVYYGISPTAPNQRNSTSSSSGYSAYGIPSERKLSYDSRSVIPTSDISRDAFSKSDTQLNAAPAIPSFREGALHPSYVHPKSSSADQLQPDGAVISDSLNIPHLDRGMFSDVDYDIEVSERVNRWETYMKKRSDPDLGTIQERNEQDLLPRNIRRSVYMEQKLEIPQSPVGPVSQSFTWSNLRTLKPSSSDPMIHLAADPQMIAQETKSLFHLIREPVSGAQYHTTSAVSTFYHAPVPQLATGGLLTAAELREQMLANKQPALQPATHGVPTITANGGKYVSRYEELEELKDAKSDSVRDLCRRFDLDFQLDSDSQLQGQLPSKHDDDTDWSKLISDLEDKIKETEVWSPNMESNKGDMVSIERVKARTLQTIPFSEDPFWKEIEEMTSFEKMFNGTGLDDPLSFRQHQLDYPHSQSYTLPTQPRTSARDRMHRSKSLYTPNITPLTISVDKYSAPSALDDVLDDIKTSLEKQSSPKVRKAGDSSDSHRSSPGPPFPEVNISSSSRPRMYADVSRSYWDDTHLGVAPSVAPAPAPAPAPGPAPAQGLLLTYAAQQPAQPVLGMQEYPNVVNGNYQLDPNILKQKLLNTGLAQDQLLKSPGRIRPKPPPPLIIPQSSQQPPTLFSVTHPAPLKSQPVPPRNVPSSEEKINQVNQSMEDLRQIAKDVESKINQIKTKLVRADEKNLDKILLALRKFAPAASPKSFEPRNESFQDFYVKKKSKLSDALTELERIYKSLNLDDESLLDRAERRDYPSYRSQGPPQAPSITERPEQKIETSSISFQVAKPDRFRSKEPERKSEADYEAISKSFQAILDEVNQTSAVIAGPSRMQTSPGNIVPRFNYPPQTGPSPEPVRKISAPQMSPVSSIIFQPKPEVAVSPDPQRKTLMRTGIPRPLNLPVVSPDPGRKGLALMSTTAKVVQPGTQRTVTQEPLIPRQVAQEPLIGKSGKAMVPIPKKVSTLDEPQRHNLSANVSKLMTQSGIPPETQSQSVSIVLKSPGAPSTSSSQPAMSVSSSQTPPAVAPRDRKARGRFRSKNPDLVDDDVAVRKARSKSTPRAETQSTGVSPTTADYLKPRESSPPQSHLRLRPEKDADIMHDDLAYRSLRKDVATETPKQTTATSTVEFQIKQPATPPSVAKFEKTFDIHAAKVSEKKPPSPHGSPKQRTVETQTSSQELKKKTLRGRHPHLKNDASSSESSDSKRRPAKIGRGIARMVEIFSSSDEEKSRKSKPLHTRSAPDLTLAFTDDDDLDLKDESRESDIGSKTLGHIKTPMDVSVSDKVVSSETSEVSTPTSPSAKPPVHPLKKQAASPEKTVVVPEQKVVKDVSGKSEVDNLEKVFVSSRGKRGKSAERGAESDSAILEKPERPKSFHELLASFEPNTNRLQRLKTLRKCASEDIVMPETVVQRTYHSQPYHSEPHLAEQREKAPTREEVRSWRLAVP
ncbi:uncharacterized protein [Haliotis cracherodii]|uniref:uncharacterized protein isoform X2 n=1 Tax=Haliotis cracherodii TaxID=6455 RepID=UPI0039E92207